MTVVIDAERLIVVLGVGGGVTVPLVEPDLDFERVAGECDDVKELDNDADFDFDKPRVDSV